MSHADPVSVPAVPLGLPSPVLVRIQARSDDRRPGFHLVGLPPHAERAARDRVRAAAINSGFRWPDAVQVAIDTTSPTSDTGLDVAIALAVLATTDQLPAGLLRDVLCVGELGLDGQIRSVRDVPTRLAVAVDAGIAHAVVPAADLTDAARTPGLTAHAARTLRELIIGLRGEQPLLNPAAWPTEPVFANTDLAEIPDAASAQIRRIMEVAAAGGHHVLTIGRGTGATLFAERLPRLLPDLDEATAEQVAALYRQAGILPADAAVLRRPPWQAPHHTSMVPAWTGNRRRPGAIALAHGGLLVCDDAAELSDRVLEILRHTLDQRRVLLASGGGAVEYPARFQLILNADGCPNAGDDCDLPQASHRRYLHRLAILRDRLDICQTLPPLPAWTDDDPPGESSTSIAARVAAARATAAARWAGQPWSTNAEVTDDALHASLANVPAHRYRALDEQINAGELTGRGAGRVLRLAWTLADLAGRPTPDVSDVDEALALRHGQVHQ